MGWRAELCIDYSVRPGPQGAPRTVAQHRHQGPLRVLQSLYPEGPICHQVMVHPPSGLAGGDQLDIRLNLAGGTHALLTTPGATRFYRTEGEAASQSLHAVLESGARLEWLPLENIAYNGCIARNSLRFELAPGAELLGWDITALGLPAAGGPFLRGSFQQHLELTGAWLERGLIDASDRRLLDGPLGLNGMRCMATLFLAGGTPMARDQRDELLELARGLIAMHKLEHSAAVTAPNPQTLVLRALAPMVEPCLNLLQQVRQAWRSAHWGLSAATPRVWIAAGNICPGARTETQCMDLLGALQPSLNLNQEQS